MTHKGSFPVPIGAQSRPVSDQNDIFENGVVMKAKQYLLVIAVLLTLPFAALAQSSPAQPGQAAPVEVKIDNFSFSPGTVTVRVGSTVRWTNRDDIPHTVVSDNEILKSKTLDTDEQYSYTFANPGTYDYFCSIHPKMTGRVVVQ